MIIQKDVHQKILNEIPYAPPETGGILGGKNNIIHNVKFDINESYSNRAIYIPNINYLNSVIEEWNKQGIELLGLFHSHPNNNFTLSKFDETQIIAIMKAVSNTVNKLYFPIIIPKKSMHCYCAEIDVNGHVCITSDEILLI